MARQVTERHVVTGCEVDGPGRTSAHIDTADVKDLLELVFVQANSARVQRHLRWRQRCSHDHDFVFCRARIRDVNMCRSSGNMVRIEADAEVAQTDV